MSAGNSRASVTPFAELANLFPSTTGGLIASGARRSSLDSSASRGLPSGFVLSPNLFGNAVGANNIQRIVPKKKSGYQPSNCIECPRPSFLLTDDREPYRIVTAHIEKDPLHNCGTIEADNLLKLWKAIELPAKLKKADESMTFFYSEKLEIVE